MAKNSYAAQIRDLEINVSHILDAETQDPKLHFINFKRSLLTAQYN